MISLFSGQRNRKLEMSTLPEQHLLNPQLCAKDKGLLMPKAINNVIGLTAEAMITKKKLLKGILVKHQWISSKRNNS